MSTLHCTAAAEELASATTQCPELPAALQCHDTCTSLQRAAAWQAGWLVPVQLLAEQQLLTAYATADMLLCNLHTASQLPLQHRRPDLSLRQDQQAMSELVRWRLARDFAG